MIKNILLAALFALPMTSQAYQNDDYISHRSDDFYVEVLRWCDSNNVMTQDPRGNLYVVADCNEQGLTCRTYQIHKMGRTLFTAACESKRN